MTAVDRELLKSAITGMLDSIAREHPLGHQKKKARRYVIQSPAGREMELMLERDADGPLNVWCLAEIGAGLPPSIESKSSPASELRMSRGKSGELNYGRHSALEKMPQLGEADLVYLKPKSLAEVGQIIDAMFAASARSAKRGGP